jgi:hypothetical protein
VLTTAASEARAPPRRIARRDGSDAGEGPGGMRPAVTD